MAWQPDYITTAELRSFLKIGDSDDDTELDFAIAAASRAVDRATNRQFGQVDLAEERNYTAFWDRRRRRWLVEIDDLMDDTDLAITVNDGDDSVTDFDLEPINAAAVSRPWISVVVSDEETNQPTNDQHDVAITALWGWTSVPEPIKQATLLQASRLFSRRTSPYGIAGSPELGSELRLLAKVDPDVQVVLGPYIRWWAAA